MYQVLFILFVPFVLAFDGSLEKVKKAFDAANIPVNTSLVFDPTVLQEVTFPQTSGPPVTIHAGMSIPESAVALPPIFSIANHPPTDITLFVVAALDLDAPTPQNTSLSEVRHFLGGNFSPSTKGPKATLLSNSTPAITEWVQPGPKVGDAHRYVFFLFKQPDGFNENAAKFVNSSTSIVDWSLKTFVDEVGLGNPLGGTFMLSGPHT